MGGAVAACWFVSYNFHFHPPRPVPPFNSHCCVPGAALVLITEDLIIAKDQSNDELAPTPQHHTNYLYAGTISPFSCALICCSRSPAYRLTDQLCYTESSSRDLNHTTPLSPDMIKRYKKRGNIARPGLQKTAQRCQFRCHFVSKSSSYNSGRERRCSRKRLLPPVPYRSPVSNSWNVVNPRIGGTVR